ncbi:Hamartin protein-domain-containing protein [Ilyonectria robusta]|uniref:Hamartin protein-domain-containing protein n=1 Tax=Ilyonectria robusta TaxID=1079257 RepID=UPI001E8E4CE0|nr:Hamartin protein-domain-containing protein [Ilyonectria robusta]KAH8735569.1 Hamartin protein-domain-containing protein [Ilyonectria robusta]
MASSASLRDLSKAIIVFLAEPTTPLPDDLSQVIDAYFRRHPKFDDAAADRLHEELSSIFDKHVKDAPTAFAPWLAILRRLLPALRTPDRIFALWDACAVLSAKASPEKDVVNESLASIMDILSLAEEATEAPEQNIFSNPLVDRLLTGWIDKLYPAASEGVASADYNEKITREALIQFGTRHPKDMFTTLNQFFVKSQHRKAVLRFISHYLQSQPPHIHLILQTPLFGNILKCLQRDTSTTIISVALTAVIMLLPQMPSSLVPYLPTLFNIYARLLFWSRERAGIVEPQIDDSDQAGPWEVCTYRAGVDDHPVYHLLNYYTILYGLYPINFMDYIRKPQRYLRHANVANANDMEVQPTEIRHQSERFRRHHLLHPNFYTLTIDSEKTDLSRWIKSEASEVVAECTGLCLVTELNQLVSQTLPSIPAAEGPMSEDSTKDGHDPALLSGSSMVEPLDGYRITQSSSMESIVSGRRASGLTRQGSQSSHPSTRESMDARNRDPSVDSPSLLPHLTQSASHTQLQDMIQSNKTIKSSLHQSLANDSVPSLSLSHQESVPERPAAPSMTAQPTIGSPLSLTETSTQIANLQRRVLILQNDLNFERYLKQQHMAHIGDLRRRQLEEEATEAETQNLVIMNRNLRTRFDEAKKAEMQVRRESEKSRAMAKKWEADLANKLKNLRDESKRLKTEFEAVQKELENSKAECEKLRVLVCEAEVKELNSQQSIQSIEIRAAEIDRLKSEVDRRTVAERDQEAKEVERKRYIDFAVEAKEKADLLSAQLVSRESEVERVRKLFQSQIETLQARLLEAQEGRAQSSPHARAAVEGALAASREKQAELQKQCNLLMRKYTALQSSLLDMKTGATPGQLRIDTSHTTEVDSESLSMSASPVMMKTRPHRVLSNPELVEGAAYNVTPPLEQKLKLGTPMSGGWAHRPGSPSGTDWSGDGSLSMSPDQRAFIRSDSSGRLMARSHSDLFSSSMGRRDSKDKGKDDGSGKKDKKAGLRGIRGFMYE